MIPSPARRAVAGLAIASTLGLALAGCGVKTGSTASSQASTTSVPTTTGATDSTTTARTTEPTTSGGESGPGSTAEVPTTPPGTRTISPQVEQAIVDAYVRLGLTRTQATCLAHGFLDAFGGDMSKITDFSAINALLAKCQVSITDFGKRPGA
ncbi:MAG: hypothetical protein JWN46_2950 [Acidimicrobiales bacterium]|nr:hypothetical protein [Acidimicrobiales bacterium]